MAKMFNSKSHARQVLESQWCFEPKEKEFCNKLADWFKSVYSDVDAVVYTGVTGMTYKGAHGEEYGKRFRPDIDVLLVTKNKVAAYEVKLLRGKKNKYLVNYTVGSVFDGQTGEITIKEISGVDSNIYSGIGQTLFDLLRCDKAFLVVPEPAIDLEIKKIIDSIPIGLMCFDKEGGFRVRKEAPEPILYSLGESFMNDRNRILEIVWQNKGTLDSGHKEFLKGQSKLDVQNS